MSDDDEGWRFGIDEVGGDDPDADAADGRTEPWATADEDADGESQGEGVAGTTDRGLPNPEPESVTAENAFFVLLGAATMAGIIALFVV